ncbi:hypothetical protein MP638_005741 [Amoeboaphelidium occidentale]|nr:hypothetical protein MP638_005741 [Amoeboaphelidium occidentale]
MLLQSELSTSQDKTPVVSPDNDFALAKTFISLIPKFALRENLLECRLLGYAAIEFKLKQGHAIPLLTEEETYLTCDILLSKEKGSEKLCLRLFELIYEVQWDHIELLENMKMIISMEHFDIYLTSVEWTVDSKELESVLSRLVSDNSKVEDDNIIRYNLDVLQQYDHFLQDVPWDEGNEVNDFIKTFLASLIPQNKVSDKDWLSVFQSRKAELDAESKALLGNSTMTDGSSTEEALDALLDQMKELYDDFLCLI